MQAVGGARRSRRSLPLILIGLLLAVLSAAIVGLVGYGSSGLKHPLGEALLTARLVNVVEIYRYQLGDDASSSVAISNDGARIAYNSFRYSKISVRSVEHGDARDIRYSPIGVKASGLTWHPDGKRLYACVSDQFVEFDTVNYRENTAAKNPGRACRAIILDRSGDQAYVAYAFNGDNYDIRKYGLREGVIEEAAVEGTDTRQVVNHSLAISTDGRRLYFFAVKYPKGSDYWQKSNYLFPQAVVDVFSTDGLKHIKTLDVLDHYSYGYGAGAAVHPNKEEFAFGATIGDTVGKVKNDVLLPSGKKVPAEELNEAEVKVLAQKYGPLKYYRTVVPGNRREALRILRDGEHGPLDLIVSKTSGQITPESISQVRYTSEGDYLLAGSAIQTKIYVYSAECHELLQTLSFNVADLAISAASRRFAIVDTTSTSLSILQYRDVTQPSKCGEAVNG